MCESDPKNKGMKRHGNLFENMCSTERLELADKEARRGKGPRADIRLHDANREGNIALLRELLLNREYRTSAYRVFKVYEPKERDVYMLPFFPDRIVHHALVKNVLEPVLVPTFTRDTYSCIKGRGIHAAFERLKAALKDREGTRYCLKLDIKKFYPSVDHEVLKVLLRRKIKDADMLWLMDEIIDSAPGLPIGNYTSQYFANYYLNGFDHWIKEVKGVRYYFRYADDIVILGPDKKELHLLLADIKTYLKVELRLKVKENHQVFPVEKRGIDFVGYVTYPTHSRVRKSIKQACARKLKHNCSPATIASYMGWFTHCNSRHLTKKLLREKLQGTGYKK